MALQKIPGRAIQLDLQESSDVMYHNGADWVRLAKGEAGQVLVVNDAGTFPQWGTSDWVYRGSIRGFSMGGANHHDLPGGGGTGVWYFFSDIYSHEFASDGNAVDSTGDLVAPSHAVSGFSSETHSFVAGGRNNTNSASVNTIQSFQNTNPSGNATDLADLTVVNHHMTPVSGLTHGYATGGVVSATTLEKFAFANTANATLVGNLPNTHSGTEGGGVTDSTADYGYIAGSGSPQVNHISRFSFANETTTDDVGDVTAVSGHASGASSETHGYFLGAGDFFTNLDKYIFASSANATDVGNLYHGASLWGGAGGGGGRGNGMSSMTHGYCAGGELYTDIGKFAFANESNTTDVGDLGSGLTTLRAHHASSHF